MNVQVFFRIQILIFRMPMFADTHISSFKLCDKLNFDMLTAVHLVISAVSLEELQLSFLTFSEAGSFNEILSFLWKGNQLIYSLMGSESQRP